MYFSDMFKSFLISKRTSDLPASVECYIVVGKVALVLCVSQIYRDLLYKRSYIPDWQEMNTDISAECSVDSQAKLQLHLHQKEQRSLLSTLLMTIITILGRDGSDSLVKRPPLQTITWSFWIIANVFRRLFQTFQKRQQYCKNVARRSFHIVSFLYSERQRCNKDYRGTPDRPTDSIVFTSGKWAYQLNACVRFINGMCATTETVQSYHLTNCTLLIHTRYIQSNASNQARRTLSPGTGIVFSRAVSESQPLYPRGVLRGIQIATDAS